MHANQQVRRHADGVIDVAFYRQRAERRHRLARRIIIRRAGTRLAKILLAAVATITGSLARYCSIDGRCGPSRGPDRVKPLRNGLLSASRE